MAGTHWIIQKRQEIILADFRLHHVIAASTINLDAVNQLYKHLTFNNRLTN